MKSLSAAITAICLCFLATACGEPDDFDSAGGKCVSYGMKRIAEAYTMTPLYDVTPTIVTPKGINIDPSSNDISGEAVDCIVDKVEQCLFRKFGNPPRIPDDVMRDAYCVDSTFEYPIPRECVTVKVPDENPVVKKNGDWIPADPDALLGWRWNCDHTQQLLDWKTPDDYACRAKGLEPRGPQCPCSWRAGVQDEHTVVTPPNFLVFPDWFIRVFTGCLNPWGSPELAECARALTAPEDMSPSCTE